MCFSFTTCLTYEMFESAHVYWARSVADCFELALKDIMMKSCIANQAFSEKYKTY